MQRGMHLDQLTLIRKLERTMFLIIGETLNIAWMEDGDTDLTQVPIRFVPEREDGPGVFKAKVYTLSGDGGSAWQGSCWRSPTKSSPAKSASQSPTKSAASKASQSSAKSTSRALQSPDKARVKTPTKRQVCPQQL